MNTEENRMVRVIDKKSEHAQALLELDAEYGGFGRYLGSHGGFAETVADLKRQFRFIGDSGAYHFLYVIGQPVPPYEQWSAARGSRARRQRTDTAARVRPSGSAA